MSTTTTSSFDSIESVSHAINFWNELADIERHCIACSRSGKPDEARFGTEGLRRIAELRNAIPVGAAAALRAALAGLRVGGHFINWRAKDQVEGDMLRGRKVAAGGRKGADRTNGSRAADHDEWVKRDEALSKKIHRTRARCRLIAREFKVHPDTVRRVLRERKRG
jgi:hypothetical protein